MTRAELASVGAAEIWQWSGGDVLELRLTGSDDGPLEARRLGPDDPQVVVQAGWWQAACPLGAWTLVGRIVAPSFTFDGFELAPPGWEPGVGRSG
jgi:hypothetical protein